MPESVIPPPRVQNGAQGSTLDRQLALQRARRAADPLLSLVVPVFNEEVSIDIFLDAVTPLMERDGLRFEIVFVNDGSRDNTLLHLLDRSAADRRLRIVNLSRNFGKEAALLAGLDHARLGAVIFIDGDGQHPPALIETMVSRWLDEAEARSGPAEALAPAPRFVRKPARPAGRAFACRAGPTPSRL